MMPKTAVGLFENPDLVDEVVRQIEALGFPRKEVRTLEQPTSFEVTGVMSFPRLDYQVTLIRELKRIGAAEAEAHSYLDGGRRGSGRIERAGRGAVQHWHSQGQRREIRGGAQVRQVSAAGSWHGRRGGPGQGHPADHAPHGGYSTRGGARTIRLGLTAENK